MRRLTAAGVLAAALISAAAPCAAQVTMTGSEQTARLRYALAHFDRETQTLATMRNQISSREVVPVAVGGLSVGTPERRTLAATRSGGRHAALIAALGKATVADVDRNNGQSEDQSSLAEYLQHLNVDPNRVVAVDVDARQDRENPRVLVFYRR
ncbi:MAG TPA: hypothetical protein VHT53_12130 [Candidatus Elarobacter sp.]|jgi:hypothetical protein|nr:hypothetical protein [Candidatus Elarobacter sp.]